MTDENRELRMFFERPFMIISFSSRHRAQFRFPFLPAGVCLTMVHLIENCRFSFLLMLFLEKAARLTMPQNTTFSAR